MKGKKTEGFLISLLGVWLILSIIPFVGYTAVPPQINYQGYLTESEGIPVDGTVQMTFIIYDAETKGNGLWSETRAVTVSRGVYNVGLGETNPINLDFDTQYYLGIQAGSDDEMAPRLALTSVGYAFRAMSSETDSDTLGELSCNNSQVAKSNGTTWICADDENTQLSEIEIETYVTNEPLDLNPNTTLGGASISTGAHTTSFTKLTDQVSDSQIPSGIARDSEVMTTVLANDGAGSTLDADTLDGKDSTAFMSASTDNWVDTTGDTMTGDLNVLGNVGIGTATPQARLHVNGDLITKGPWVDVRAFGAQGDGITDDTAFIQAAIDATSAGGTMILPPGTYKTTDNITIEKPLNIVGFGLDTVLFVSGAHYGFIIGAPSASDRGGSIRYLKIQGTEAGLAGIRQGNLSIYTNQPVQVTIKDVHITGFTSPSVTHPVRPGSDGTTGGVGIFDSSSHGFIYENCYFYKNHYGFVIDSAQESTTHVFNKCFFHENTSHGLLIRSGTAYNFFGCGFESNGGSGIVLLAQATNPSGIMSTNFWGCCTEDNNKTEGIYTVILDAPHPLSAIRNICFYGGRYAYASGKNGFFINRGRETLLSNVNLSNGSNLGTSVKTTNSFSVLITGGRDDAAPMILDSKTVRIPTNAADGGFYDIEGKIRTRMGTGAGKALVGGVAYLNGSSKGTTAVTTEETLMSYTLPADSLSSVGKGLRIIAWGATAYNTNKKTIRIKFGETVVMINKVVTAPANLDWRLEAIIIGHMNSIEGIGSGVFGATMEAVRFTSELCNLAAPVEIKLTGQNGTPSVDDIHAQGLIVETLN